MTKRWEYYRNEVEEIRKRNPGCTIMTKEKYWRFDISYYNVNNIEDRARLDTLELESEKRCMHCAKLKKQYETWFFGWMRHYCLKCYIIYTFEYYWRKFLTLIWL